MLIIKMVGKITSKRFQSVHEVIKTDFLDENIVCILPCVFPGLFFQLLIYLNNNYSVQFTNLLRFHSLLPPALRKNLPLRNSFNLYLFRSCNSSLQQPQKRQRKLKLALYSFPFLFSFFRRTFCHFF